MNSAYTPIKKTNIALACIAVVVSVMIAGGLIFLITTDTASHGRKDLRMPKSLEMRSKLTDMYKGGMTVSRGTSNGLVNDGINIIRRMKVTLPRTQNRPSKAIRVRWLSRNHKAVAKTPLRRSGPMIPRKYRERA